MGQDLFGTQYVQHQPNKYNNKNISISDAENFDKHTAKCALSFRDTSFKNNDICWPQQPLTEKVSDISEKLDF